MRERSLNIEAVSIEKLVDIAQSANVKQVLALSDLSVLRGEHPEHGGIIMISSPEGSNLIVSVKEE